jgi:hypothetical protein
MSGPPKAGLPVAVIWLELKFYQDVNGLWMGQPTMHGPRQASRKFAPPHGKASPVPGGHQKKDRWSHGTRRRSAPAPDGPGPGEVCMSHVEVQLFRLLQAAAWAAARPPLATGSAAGHSQPATAAAVAGRATWPASGHARHRCP